MVGEELLLLRILRTVVLFICGGAVRVEVVIILLLLLVLLLRLVLLVGEGHGGLRHHLVGVHFNASVEVLLRRQLKI